MMSKIASWFKSNTIRYFHLDEWKDNIHSKDFVDDNNKCYTNLQSNYDSDNIRNNHWNSIVNTDIGISGKIIGHNRQDFHFKKQIYSDYSSISRKEPFFIKPRLEINKNLKKYPVRIKVFKEKDDANNYVNREEFDGYIWTVQVKNRKILRFTKSLEQIKSNIYIDNIDKTIHLRWSSRVGIPLEYQEGTIIIEPQSAREEYRKRLGYEYIKQVCAIGREFTTIHPNENDEFYIAFSTNELNHVFLISPDGQMAWYDGNILTSKLDEAFLMLKIPSNSKIRFNFSLSDKLHQYGIKVNSYDDIRLY